MNSLFVVHPKYGREISFNSIDEGELDNDGKYDYSGNLETWTRIILIGYLKHI